MVTKIDDWLRGLLADGPMAPPRASAYRWLLIVCILGSTAYAALDTVPDFWGDFARWGGALNLTALVAMTIDYLLRGRLAWDGVGEEGDEASGGWRAVGRYVASAYGIFDLLAVAPFALGLVFGMPKDLATVFGIVRFLKLARYSPALETLGAVVANELQSLLSALFIIILLAISAATLLYFAERHANPGFSTVPDALWWAIVTLTTVGYGDVVPLTPYGKLLGAVVAVLGLCMFALPASILASGFAEEMRRHTFVNNWQLVSKVPFFSGLNAGQIAEIAELLKPFRAVKGEVLMQAGDIGESMYFIVSGQVDGSSPGGRFILKAGDFFGEIALIERCPRTATIKSLGRSQFLVLDVRDFQKFIASYPDLLSVIKRTARQRQGKEDTERRGDRRGIPDRRGHPDRRSEPRREPEDVARREPQDIARREPQDVARREPEEVE